MTLLNEDSRFSIFLTNSLSKLETKHLILSNQDDADIVCLFERSGTEETGVQERYARAEHLQEVQLLVSQHIQGYRVAASLCDDVEESRV